MKIHLPNDSQQSLGGGWTFRDNLIKGINNSKEKYVDTIEESDVCLITSPTMITRDTFNKMKALKKKIVLRLDNVPRNSRNRNTGISRLKEFAQASDAIVWQCQWAMDYIGHLVPYDALQRIIYNGVDTDIFNVNTKERIFGEDPVYIYSRYSRDETKRWEEAWYEYQKIHKANPKSKLIIIGRFSPENIEYNFDFFNGEQFEYLGVIDNQFRMARVLQSCDWFLASYYCDCYSNTYQEALACGVQLHVSESTMTGGTPELLQKGVTTLEEMTDDYINLFQEVL